MAATLSSCGPRPASTSDATTTEYDAVSQSAGTRRDHVWNMRTQMEGFTNPIRAGLWAEARGNAPTLSEAVEVFANFTRGVAAVLSVAANAPVGHFTADIAFDNTPGRHEREYFRRSFPADPQVPSQGRRLNSTLTLALFTGWMHKLVKELERWHRAANAYHRALQEWEPGAEIPAMSHL